MMRLAGWLLALVATAGYVDVGAAHAQSRGFRLDDVFTLIGGDIPTERIVAMAQEEGCLAFTIDSATESRLRSARADDTLIEQLKSIPTCQPAPAKKADTPSVRARGSSGGAAFKSILLPGLGQFTTGRPAMGALFLGAAGGAIAAGALSKSETIYCATPGTTSCAPADVIRTDETSKLALGLAGYAAVAVVAAIDAASGARRAAAQAFRIPTRSGSLAVEAMLPSMSVDGSSVRMEFVRLRF